MATGQSVLSNNERAGWRDMLAPPEHAHAALAIAFLFASLLIVPLCTAQQAATLYLVAAICFYYTVVRSFPAMLGLGVPLIAVYAITASLSLTAVVASLLLGGACGAFLLIHYHDPREVRHWALVLLPVLAYGAAALLTRDPVRGLLVLLPLAIAVVFAYCILRYHAHTPSVVAGAVALGAALAVAALVTLAVTGALNANPLGTIAGGLRTGIAEALLQTRTLYAEMGTELLLTDADVANAAIIAVNLLPALLCVLLVIVSYLSWRALLRLMLTWNTVPRIPLRVGALTMSPVSAALFLISFVAALFANAEEMTLAGAIFQNVSIVLEPGLALVGGASLLARGRSRSCSSYLFFFAVFFILWTNPSTGLALASIIGAVHILLAHFLPSTTEKGD